MAMHLWPGPGGARTSQCQEPIHPLVSCMLLMLHMQLIAQLTATKRSSQAGTACDAKPSHFGSPGYTLLAAAAKGMHAPAAADGTALLGLRSLAHPCLHCSLIL